MEKKEDLIKEVKEKFTDEKIEKSVGDCIIRYIEKAHRIGFVEGMAQGVEVMTKTQEILHKSVFGEGRTQ